MPVGDGAPGTQPVRSAAQGSGCSTCMQCRRAACTRSAGGRRGGGGGGWGWGGRVCRSDSSAPAGLGSWEAGGPARSPPLPPTRQGVPASPLPAAEAGGGGRRGGAAGLAGLVPGFLSAFPEQDQPGEGTQRKPPSPGAQPGTRVLAHPGPALCPSPAAGARGLSPHRPCDATHSPPQEAERRKGRPQTPQRPGDVSVLTPS